MPYILSKIESVILNSKFENINGSAPNNAMPSHDKPVSKKA